MLLALAAAAAQPQPGELKTFGDWAVGCDNARSCKAVALVPDGVERDDYLFLWIDREGASAAKPKVRVPPSSRVQAYEVDQVFELRVDDRSVVGVSFLDPPPDLDRSLTDALANGREVVLATKQGRRMCFASLKGLSAALLYMDERQGRIGTVGALRRKGVKPDSAVPAPPPLPRVVQPAPRPKPPRALSPAAAARLIGSDSARCEYAKGPVRPRAFRLDPAHSLAVVDHPCGNGAYNAVSSVFIVDEAGRASPARFDANTGMGPDDGDILVNGDWDPRQRRLSSFAKARSLGDCGTIQSFAWDGERFRLVRQETMGECRGSLKYITTWRAAVATAR